MLRCEALPCVFCAVYHALYLEERTLVDLSEKIAGLYNITPQQITQIYRQKSSGIHILVSDEVCVTQAPTARFWSTEGISLVTFMDQDVLLGELRAVVAPSV